MEQLLDDKYGERIYEQEDVEEWSNLRTKEQEEPLVN
jgi:hypothetical protein